MRPRCWWVGIASLLFLVEGIWLAQQRFTHFRSTADLSIFASAFHGADRGDPFLFTPMLGESLLGHHLSLVLIPLSWAYQLFGDHPPVLMWAQVLGMAAAAPVLFGIIRELTGDARAGLLAAGLLLACRSMLGAAVACDFHPIALLPLPLLVAVWGLVRGSWTWALVGALGVCMVQEDAPLTLAAVAACWGWSRRQWRMRLVLVAIGVVGAGLLVAAQKTLFPTDATIIAARYGWLWGATEPSQTPRWMLHEAALAHLKVLRMYGYASILSPGAWGAAVPGILQNSLADWVWPRKLLLHYGVTFATVMALGVGPSWIHLRRALAWAGERLQRRGLPGATIRRVTGYALVFAVVWIAFDDHRMGSVAPTMKRFRTAWVFPEGGDAPGSCVEQVNRLAPDLPPGRWGIHRSLLPHLTHLDAVELQGAVDATDLVHAAYDERLLYWGRQDDPDRGIFQLVATAERLRAGGFTPMVNEGGCAVWSRAPGNERSHRPSGEGRVPSEFDDPTEPRRR